MSYMDIFDNRILSIAKTPFENIVSAVEGKVIVGDVDEYFPVVDEKTQAVDGIEEAEILEIIDHHRLGGLETVGPLHFRNQPVGCTATIVYHMYKENDISLDENTAALLGSAILSDTLMFRSPTSTIIDEMVAKELADIAGIECQELSGKMFRAGSNLKGKKPKNNYRKRIIYQVMMK